MKPYPFALLNHFTVPFRRSTFAPSGKQPFTPSLHTGLQHVRMPKSATHCAAEGWDCQGARSQKIVILAGFYALSVEGQPKHGGDGFGIADGAALNHLHSFRERHE